MTRPGSDEAPTVASGQGFQEQGKADNRDCAEAAGQCKRIATVTARAALAGLVLQPLTGGLWQVLNQFGQPTIVQSLQAAEALVYGCEMVRADVAALMSRLRPVSGEGARHE